jgi:hypothetical protein
MELELTRMEQSDDDLTDSSDREDSDTRESEPHWPSDPSEIKCRCHALIAHEQETLAELLHELETEVESNSENSPVEIVEKLKRCFKCIDEMMEYATQFLRQALRVEMRNFTGFYYGMHEDASQSIRQALTIVSKLRRGNLFFLVPSAKGLVVELDEIRVLVSRKTLEQVEETLEGYDIKRTYTLREIEKLETRVHPSVRERTEN